MNAVNAETYEQHTAELPVEQIKLQTRNLDFFYGKNQALYSVSLPVMEKGRDGADRPVVAAASRPCCAP